MNPGIRGRVPIPKAATRPMLQTVLPCWSDTDPGLRDVAAVYRLRAFRDRARDWHRHTRRLRRGALARDRTWRALPGRVPRLFIFDPLELAESQEALSLSPSVRDSHAMDSRSESGAKLFDSRERQILLTANQPVPPNQPVSSRRRSRKSGSSSSLIASACRSNTSSPPISWASDV